MIKINFKKLALLLILNCFSSLSFAENSGVIDIKKVVASKVSQGTYNFAVTLKSPDKNWDYYADGWQVINPKTGEIYGTRVLGHPHETEQPFTRSAIIKIPANIKEVLIVAKMKTENTYPKTGYKLKLN